MLAALPANVGMLPVCMLKMAGGKAFLFCTTGKFFGFKKYRSVVG